MERALDRAGVNRRVIEQFRAGEEIDGMHRDRILLRTTTGRPRAIPMVILERAD